MTSTERQRWSVVGIACGAVPYVNVLWGFGLRPLRRAFPAGTFSDFFDIQARAIMRGNLTIPRGSLGIEEFLVDGRSHMYFGVAPALLRIPVLFVTDRFDSRLTAPSMLVGWCVLAVGVARLVWVVRDTVRPDAVLTRAEGAAAAALIALVTGGSSVLFLASMPYVFHEVYIWSVAWSTWTINAVLVAFGRPTGPRILLVGVLASLTMLTRAPAGWGLSIAIAALGVWLGLSRPVPSRRAGAAFATAGAIPIMLGAAVNWVRFQHALRFPIEDQVWSRINPARQAALAANSGRIDGLQFLPTTLTAYFRPDGIRVVPYPPFITFPAHPPRAIGDVVLDQTYRTGSITAFMPLLLVAAVVGAAISLRRRSGARFVPIRFLLVGCAISIAPVLGLGYVSYRYTAEFLPLLSLGAAVALAATGDRLARHRRRRAWLATVALVGVFTGTANLVVAAAESRVATGGGALRSYVGARASISSLTGRPGPILRVAELPQFGRADELAIVGDCDGLYFGTGETVDSWVPVEMRNAEIELTIDRGRPGTLELVRFRGVSDRSLMVELDDTGRVRLWLDLEDGDYVGEWNAGLSGVVIRLVHNLELGTVVMESDAGFSAFTYATDRDPHGIAVPVATEILGGDPSRSAGGLHATIRAGDPLALCARLLREA